MDGRDTGSGKVFLSLVLGAEQEPTQFCCGWTEATLSGETCISRCPLLKSEGLEVTGRIKQENQSSSKRTLTEQNTAYILQTPN